MNIVVPIARYLINNTAQTFLLFAQDIINYITNRKDCTIISCLESDIISNTKNIDIDWCIAIHGSGITKELIKYYNKNNIKIAIWWDDIHYHNQKALDARHFLFDNADILFVTYIDHFLKMKEYKSYFHKTYSLPFGAPINAFSFNMNMDDRKNKLIMSGRCSPIYSSRNIIINANNKNIDILTHPGYKNPTHKIVGNKYYKFLSTYKGGIVTTADKPLNYLVGKYFEVPACGCIPFFEEVSELKKLGFIPNKHYIPIDLNNPQSISLNNIDPMIGKYARDFVLRNHSNYIRAEVLLKTIKEES